MQISYMCIFVNEDDHVNKLNVHVHELYVHVNELEINYARS